jgi:hypothetical protein
MYHCAQIDDRQHASKKSQRPSVKHRDKESMQTFDCSGWLHITISDLSDVASIKLDHHDAHIPYCSIEVPEDVVTYIHENLKQIPAQVRLNLYVTNSSLI